MTESRYLRSHKKGVSSVMKRGGPYLGKREGKKGRYPDLTDRTCNLIKKWGGGVLTTPQEGGEKSLVSVRTVTRWGGERTTHRAYL